jgi:hypothetical protein
MGAYDFGVRIDGGSGGGMCRFGSGMRREKTDGKGAESVFLA